ncbi:MAG: N-acetylmuramoyl-L-alanine amidase family protein [Oscillospiraceae bacterium]
MKKYRRYAAALAAVVLSLNTAALCASAEFVTENGSTYYLDDSGDKVTGFEEIDGKTYYFDRKGVMQTGWQTIRRRYTCYFRKDGSMVTGRAKIGGKSYYFNEKGYMQTGNVIIGNEIFLYGEDGALKKQYKNSLVEVDGKKYCTGSNGKMKTGLQKVGDNYYYFCDKGYSISTEAEKDGYIYTLDADTGLVSKTEKPLDPSSIKIKVGPYSDTATNLIAFKVKNNSDGTKLYYSGYIVNDADYNGCRVTLSIEMYNQKGELIDRETIARTTRLYTGDEYKFDDFCFISEPVYSIRFIVTRT